MSGIDELRQRKERLKLKVKALKDQQADPDVIAPIFQQYQEVAQALKDLEAGGAASPAPSTPAKQSREDMEREKESLKARIRVDKEEGKDPNEIQKMYDRYLQLKRILDADGGTPAAAPAPPPAPAAKAAPMNIEDLIKRKDQLKQLIKDMKAQPSPDEAAMREAYEEYQRVKDQIDNCAAPVGPLPGAAPAPVFAAPAPTPAPVRDSSKDDQLWLACKMGRTDEVNRLVREGGNKEHRMRFGATCLGIAAHQGHVDVVRRLLDAGAVINARADEEVTPLWVATQNKHVDVVELLLERGADMEARKDNGVSPLWLSAYCGCLPLLRVFATKGADIEALKDGITALSIAVEKGQTQCAKFLIQAGAQLEMPDRDGFTPLHVACERENIMVVRALLERGANKEALTKEGLTPIEIAAQCGYPETVKTLQEAGSIIRDSNGIVSDFLQSRGP